MPVPDDYKPSDTMPASANLRAADYKIGQKWPLVISDVTMESFPAQDKNGNETKVNKLILSFEGRDKRYVMNVTQKQALEALLGDSPNRWIGATLVLGVQRTLYLGKPTQGFVVLDATPKKGLVDVDYSSPREPGEDDL